MLIRPESIYDKIIIGNCEKILKNFPSNSIQLTITSPHMEMQLIMIYMHQRKIRNIIEA